MLLRAFLPGKDAMELGPRAMAQEPSIMLRVDPAACRSDRRHKRLTRRGCDEFAVARTPARHSADFSLEPRSPAEGLERPGRPQKAVDTLFGGLRPARKSNRPDRAGRAIW